MQYRLRNGCRALVCAPLTHPAAWAWMREYMPGDDYGGGR